MNSHTSVRALITSAAVAASFVLAGCDGESLSTNAKANKPIPEKLVKDMDQKNMDKQSPMLVRLFKQEAELEVWKQDRSGRFALLKTYPICRWSGDLGPKFKEGDRQAPEGFYSITPGQMNPQSAYYLSFNMGYPNAFDKALGRTGSQLMVHGDCSSRGCYAMTDEQISDIYSLGRESFFGGQRAFQVQAYPFRMTPQNMAQHRNNPNMPFWKMIKEGYDHFEVTHLEPKVDVCERHYVFDAQAPGGSTKPLAFNPSGACPAYQISDDVADAVREKQRDDDAKTADLIAHGAPLAKMNTGIDGGMHAVFASKLPNGQTGLSEANANYSSVSYASAPGTIPPTVNPPRPLDGQFSESDNGGIRMAIASDGDGPSGGNFLSTLAKKVGITSGSDTTATTPPPASTTLAKSTPPPKPPTMIASKPATVAAKNVRIAEPKAPEPKIAERKATPAPKPADQAQPTATTSSTSAPAEQAMAGAQPMVPSNSFESRWSSFR